jgi:HEAT repeat protein
MNILQRVAQNLPLLDSENEPTRQKARQVLDRTRPDSDCTPLFLEALRSAGADGRVYAATWLGLFHEKRAVDGLISLLNDKVPKVREAAARALGRLDDVSVLPQLTRLLNDAAEEVVLAALGALGELGDPSSLPTILARTKSWYWRRRQSAYFALHRFDDPEVLRAAREGLTDPKRQVRGTAKMVLAGIDQRRREPAQRSGTGFSRLHVYS